MKDNLNENEKLSVELTLKEWSYVTAGLNALLSRLNHPDKYKEAFDIIAEKIIKAMDSGINEEEYYRDLAIKEGREI